MPRNRSENLPPPEVDDYGAKRWYNADGKLHREDGPAVVWGNGSKFWWLNGKLHRDGHPAIEWVDGSKEWWFDGEFIRMGLA